MKHIILPAHLQSDLDWASDMSYGILWELDFQFVDITDQAVFYSYVVAIEHFVKNIWNDRSMGVVLYRGGLDILNRLCPNEDLVSAADAFADYLHRLASFLPDEIKPYCLLDKPQSAKEAQLASKARFWHLHLSLEEECAPIGILLPTDEQCTSEVLAKFDQMLKLYPGRIIPETHLTELWNGLDTLVVIEEALSVQGKRKVQGFIAAGGCVEKFGAEGFEPPTHCSQSSCASQTALCSER